MTEKNKPICVVLTGAGISAESGIPTFRAEDGLWAGHKVEEVCTPEALKKNRAKVLAFYNERRRNAKAAEPNAAHLALVELEEFYEVHIITQNVDDLHERAGSTNVLHLHGELNKARSSFNTDYIVPCLGDQLLEDKDNHGHPMRPHIVFFGENVPMFPKAEKLVKKADIVIVIGTSLQVYPANGLVNLAPYGSLIYLIDPNPNTGFVHKKVIAIKEKAVRAFLKWSPSYWRKLKNHRKLTALFKQIATSVAIYHYLSCLCLSICIISLISVSFCFGSDSATNKVSAASPVSLITGCPL